MGRKIAEHGDGASLVSLEMSLEKLGQGSWSAASSLGPISVDVESVQGDTKGFTFNACMLLNESISQTTYRILHSV